MRNKKLIICFILFILGNNLAANPLDYYIKKALTNSPLLKDLNNQLLSAKFDSLLIRAAYKPQITQVSQVMYPFTGKNFGYDEAITNGGNYSALVSVVQPLLNKRSLEIQSRSVILAKQGVQINAKISEIDLKKSVTAQYLTAYVNYRQLESNKNVLNLIHAEGQILKKLVDKGVYLLTDYMNLTVSAKAQEILIKQNFIQYKNDLNLLNFLCGIADSTTVILENPDIKLTNNLDINSSPLMLQFKLDSLKNMNSMSLLNLNYLPKLHAFVDGGFQAVIPKNIPHNFGSSVGLNFNMIIADGKQRKLQKDKIFIAEDTRLNYKTFYTAQYRQQFLQLEEQLKLDDQLIRSLAEQVRDQEKLIELYRTEIEKGLVRLLDFVTVVNNYTTTKNTLSMAEINRFQIITQMNYLK